MTQTKNSSVTPVIRYLADGAQRDFTYPFRLFNNSDLTVYLGEEQQTAGYKEVGEMKSVGGTVTFDTAPSTGVVVTLARALDYRRLSDFQEGSSLRTSVLNSEFDYQMALFQQLAEQTDRSLKKPLTADETKGEDLILPQAQADRALKWSSDGLALVNSDYNPDEAAAIALSAAQTASAAQDAVLASQSAAADSQAQATASEAAALQAAADAARSASDTAAIVPDATETMAGKVELATEAETKAGNDKTKAVHPSGLKAVIKIASVPAGAILASASKTAPSGYFLCDGAVLSRTTYAALFAAIGTAFGAGDGSTTFNGPDFRGEFLRGVDNGRGVDKNRVLGSWQVDEFKRHRHEHLNNVGGGNRSTSNHVYGYTTLPLIGIGEFVSYTGGSETRPRNIAVNFYIKY